MASVELEVEDGKWPTFKKYFLVIHPNPTLRIDPPLSDDDWVKQCILLFALDSYVKGIEKEYRQQNGPNIDMEIITL